MQAGFEYSDYGHLHIFALNTIVAGKMVFFYAWSNKLSLFKTWRGNIAILDIEYAALNGRYEYDIAGKV